VAKGIYFPGVGGVMAELIHTGATATPVSHYRIGRFAKLYSRAAQAVWVPGHRFT
jgi:hypothetical protein